MKQPAIELSPDNVISLKRAREELNMLLEPIIGLNPLGETYAVVNDMVAEIEALLGY